MDKNIEKYLQNVMGQRESHQKIFNYVDGMDNAHYIHYVEEIYENYFIYRREPISDNRSSTEFFKISYSINDSEEMDVDENEVTKVKKKISYEAISNQKGETKMAKRTDDSKIEENQCPECKGLVDSLISNESTHWVEEDRNFLEEMDLKILQKMEPVVLEKKKKEIIPDVQDPAIPETNKEEKKPVTTKEYVDGAPHEIREVLNSALLTQEKKKKELIEKITSNSKNRFTKEQLHVKDLEELEILSDLATIVNYEGQGGSDQTQNQEHEEEPLTLPVFNYEK